MLSPLPRAARRTGSERFDHGGLLPQRRQLCWTGCLLNGGKQDTFLPTDVIVETLPEATKRIGCVVSSIEPGAQIRREAAQDRMFTEQLLCEICLRDQRSQESLFIREVRFQLVSPGLRESSCR